MCSDGKTTGLLGSPGVFLGSSWVALFVVVRQSRHDESGSLWLGGRANMAPALNFWGHLGGVLFAGVQQRRHGESVFDFWGKLGLP